MTLSDWHLWILPAGLLLAGLVFGKITERLLIKAAQKVLQADSWLSRDTVTQLLKGTVVSLFVLFTAYMATFDLPLPPVGHVEDALLHARKLLTVLAMLIAIRISVRLMLDIVHQYTGRSTRKKNFPNTSIFENLIRVTIYIIGMLVILQTLGVPILPILTALGVGGLAISLALQDTLANLFAGIHMILARQIKVGDTIQLENGMAGVVSDIGWRTTTLKQVSGNYVILPNSKMASTIIINFTNPHPELNVALILPVSVDSALQEVENIAMEVGTEVGIRLLTEKYPKQKHGDFEPLIRYQSYGESWINMAVNLPFKHPMDGGTVRHELFKALHARFAEAGIHPPFPQHILHLPESIQKEAASF